MNTEPQTENEAAEGQSGSTVLLAPHRKADLGDGWRIEDTESGVRVLGRGEAWRFEIGSDELNDFLCGLFSRVMDSAKVEDFPHVGTTLLATSVARSKLGQLKAKGFEACGLGIKKGAEVGMIDDFGKVRWFSDQSANVELTGADSPRPR